MNSLSISDFCSSYNKILVNQELNEFINLLKNEHRINRYTENTASDDLIDSVCQACLKKFIANHPNIVEINGKLKNKLFANIQNEVTKTICLQNYLSIKVIENQRRINDTWF